MTYTHVLLILSVCGNLLLLLMLRSSERRDEDADSIALIHHREAVKAQVLAEVREEIATELIAAGVEAHRRGGVEAARRVWPN